ncbi:MAG: OmpA family protein [Candidatus Omnitrophica bacterium]|nr:OmpA family protein [Candidatus Omnitrophota bacterium]
MILFASRLARQRNLLLVGLSLLIMGWGSATPAAAGTEAYRNDLPSNGQFDSRLLLAKEVFEDFTVIPANGIPQNHIRNAKVLLIFPNYVTGGYVFAGRYGMGAAMIKDPKTGEWSPPAFVRLGGMSVGFQMGVQWADLILVGKGDQTLENVMNSRFAWGGSMSATAGPWGRHLEFDADWLMRSSFFAYSRAHGFFASLATDGMVLSFDDDHNELYYGRRVTGWDVLRGKVTEWPGAAEELRQAVQTYDRSVSGAAEVVEEEPVVIAPPVMAPSRPAPMVQADDKAFYLVKNIVKNFKIYFDYDSAEIRPDAKPILVESAAVLKDRDDLAVAVSGHTDVRGSREYNEKLGLRRAEAIRSFMASQGLDASRIKVVTRGFEEAVAPPNDLVGMQRDRYAHFVVAELERAKLAAAPKPELKAEAVGDGLYIASEQRNVESGLHVSTKEYVVRKGDTLWKISRDEMGSGHRWKYLFDLNRQRIPDPNDLVKGQRLLIPVE